MDKANMARKGTAGTRSCFDPQFSDWTADGASSGSYMKPKIHVQVNEIHSAVQVGWNTLDGAMLLSNQHGMLGSVFLESMAVRHSQPLPDFLRTLQGAERTHRDMRAVGLLGAF